jgi:hypothetical protein
MLNDARSHLFDAPHMVIFPALAVMTAVLSFNLLGVAGATGSTPAPARKWPRKNSQSSFSGSANGDPVSRLPHNQFESLA